MDTTELRSFLSQTQPRTKQRKQGSTGRSQDNAGPLPIIKRPFLCKLGGVLSKEHPGSFERALLVFTVFGCLYTSGSPSVLIPKAQNSPKALYDMVFGPNNKSPWSLRV